METSQQKTLRFFFLGLFLIGFISRVLPLFLGESRIFEQFPTEDGYLMLTIARYLALGFGMSTADGTLITNGTQPFVTFIWSLGYLLTGGSKLGGVIFAHIIQVLVSIAFAWVIYKVAKKIFHRHSPIYALGLSAVLFTSPQLLPHSMNFLETGFYVFIIACVIYVFYETEEEAATPWSIQKSLLVGVLLGLMFWVRIDSVFIIFAACITYLYRGSDLGISHIKQRFIRVLIFGATSVIIASPWLIYNYIYFGSIMPISGQAQNARMLAQNAPVVPSTLLEYLLVFIPIPSSLQEKMPVILFSTIAMLAATAIAVKAFFKVEKPQKSLILMGLTTVVCFTIYYGIFFGAKHFVGRYFAATAPFLALFSLGVVIFLLHTIAERSQALLKTGVAAFAVVIFAIEAGLNYRIFQTGVPHAHIQVVNWVESHVPEDTWVAAVQTGTLGYFHDKTYNLDGKVNAEALKAKHGEAYCPEDNVASEANQNCLMYYIVQSDIQYLADWSGLAGWAELPPLLDYFTLEVSDPKENLTVFKRKGAPSK
ncbi:glycosyltransferase family 39 protein [Teredinibacter turnerae]|uniref:glycosyltransferase family 39 protein n=1 Tax=Teredinibacter turnerae TaxID=2426 RepID=UPI0003F58886|nr:glycosyltransferase family 39 protein [Teredinibacter turnerae]